MLLSCARSETRRLLYNALYEAGTAKFIPKFGHLPFVMGEGNKKLSKRNPESNLFLHRDRGFIREGLLNYLALLGWSIASDRDIFTLDEMCEKFEISAVNPNPARFDQKKADAINAAHIRLLEPSDFASRLLPYMQRDQVIADSASEKELQILNEVAPLLQERLTVLGDAPSMVRFLFVEEIEFEPEALNQLPENATEIVSSAAEALRSLDEFSTAAIQELLSQVLIEQQGLKPRDAFGAVRTAISGRRVTPPLFESMEILGKDLTLARLDAFVAAR